jgi:hypothetical protein
MTYTPFVFFGYEIQLPSDIELSESIPMMYDLNGMIRSPFEIRCILPTFYPLMNEEEYARVVIGFVPEQIEDTIDLAADLKSFIDDTSLLDGMEVSHYPLFHCGIEWKPEIDSDSITDSVTESITESDLDSMTDSEDLN